MVTGYYGYWLLWLLVADSVIDKGYTPKKEPNKTWNALNAARFLVFLLLTYR